MSILRLVDERSSPRLRTVIGTLLESATSVDLAVARIRLASLDLTDEEVAGPRRCRVLLGQLDASTLLDARAAPGDAVVRLTDWALSGRLEVRSAGIGAWTPDFSVYHRPDGSTCLLGAHYFGSPHLTVGPSFTVVTDSPGTRRLLGRRFEELWSRSHDVLPAILRVLEQVHAGAPSAP